jgi:hypothetical protein
LVVKSVHPIPYSEWTIQDPHPLTRDFEYIVPLLEQADREKWTVIKVHSHLGSDERFSSADDEGDQRLLPAIQARVQDALFHCSAIMLPDGRLFGRYIAADGGFQRLYKTTVVGDDILSWLSLEIGGIDSFAISHGQIFGERTFELLRGLSVAVIGCSGIGSPVIEQLARLGVGELVLIDHDVVEARNLNRILNSTMSDAEAHRSKVDVIADSIRRMGLNTKVRTINASLWDPDSVCAVAECDVVFGCMDSIDGRYLLNRLATYYVQPYFDLGVKIVADSTPERRGHIFEICGSVHYLKPGFSLTDRKVFTKEQVQAAGLARGDPAAYAQQRKEGYVSGVLVDRPAVISLNMMIASLGVNELLARVHPFRDAGNSRFDHTEISLASMEMFTQSKPEPDLQLLPKIGLGDRSTLLDLTELSAVRGSKRRA